MTKPGTAAAINEVQSALMEAARRLSEMPDMQNDLVRFCDYWPAIDAYTPPPEVVEMVSNIVSGMVASARAIKDPTI